MELVTFEQLSAILGLSKTEDDYDDLEIIKESVADMFEDYTHRKFDEDTYSESFYTGPINTAMVPLDAIPIDSVSSVLIDDIETTAYKIMPYGIELSSKVTDAKIDVTYTGGIETVPGNLNRAALLQTVYEYQNKHSIGIEVVSTEGGSVVKPELGMLKEVKSLLNSLIHPFPRF